MPAPENLLKPSKLVPAYIPEGSGKICVVAQSPGAKEVKVGRPLVGASGELLQKCFSEVGLDWDSAMLTNVIPYQPPGNDFKDFYCAKKAEVGGKAYTRAPIAVGKYLKPEWLWRLEELKSEIQAFSPNLVIACGNEALWALCGVAGIKKYRGSIIESTLIPGQKVLPIVHPAAALRQWSERTQILWDLKKAVLEQEYPKIKTKHREIWVAPTIDDLWSWEAIHTMGKEQSLLSVDIENPYRWISCIGFAFTEKSALVVPFFDPLMKHGNFWPSIELEKSAWNFVSYMLTTYKLLGQNWVGYDTWVILQEVGIGSRRFREDTMLAHHALEPELEKGLGFLTSCYANEPAYKLLRKRSKTEKRDE